MTSPLTQTCLRKLLLVSLCLAFGAAASRAQIPPAAQAQQTTRQAVSLTPVDTGRSAVTFVIGAPKPEHDRFAIKTNLLYGAGLMAPNLGAEIALGERTTIGVSAGYSNWGNMWDFSVQGPEYDPANTYKRRIDHTTAEVEFRYWFDRRFEGHFVGVNALWAQFVVGEAKIPPVFTKMSENEGFLYGGGLTYGYLLPLAERWGVEFTIGAGVAIVEHDQRELEFTDGAFTLGDSDRFRKTFVGPTSAGITIIFKL